MTDRFDAIQIFRSLEAYGVSYVTIGGIAVQAHGGQRLTQDLDVLIASSEHNYSRLADALSDLDARILGPGGKRSARVPSAKLLATSDLWHLVTPQGRLDVLTLPAHLGSFEEMLARSHKVVLDDLEIAIASRKDLIELKRNAGRPQDLADINLLESLDGQD